VYDTLLFLHVLAAFFLGAGVVIYSAFVLGSPVNRPTRLVAEILWGIGGLGTLALGIWLALYLDAYEIWDGWIIGAIVLWALGVEAGRRGGQNYADAQKHAEQLAAAGRDEPDAELASRLRDRRAALLTGVSALAILLVLVDMIYKPGA
jgi:hypothetical protein